MKKAIFTILIEFASSLTRNSAAAKARAGREFLPPQPLPFCPPDLSAEVSTQVERSVSFLPSRRRREQSIGFRSK